MSTRTVLHEADVARALTRISHEILESNKGPEGLVILGIPTRGAVLAHRVAALLTEFSGTTVEAGALDITMYRDDLSRHPTRAPQPTAIPAGGIEGKTVVLVDDVLFSGRTIRAALDAWATSGAPPPCASRSSSTAATASCPSAPTSSARTCRVRATSGCSCGSPRSTAWRKWRSNHEAPARHDDALSRRRPAHPRRRGGHGRHAAARGQEAPDSSRAHGRQPLLRGLHAHAYLVRGGRQATVGGRHQLLREGVERLQGRVAAGHGPDAAGDGGRRGRHPARRLRSPAHARDERVDHGGGRQRG